MDGIRILLFGVGILILIINVFISSGNLIKIVTYCWKTNTIDQYWESFYKSSVNARAIISTVIGSVLAVFVFIVIAPMIVLRKSMSENKAVFLINEGLFFEYPDLELENENRVFNTNIDQIFSERLKEIKVTGKIRIDAIILLSELDELCKNQNKEFTYKVMEKLNLDENVEAQIPLLLSIDNQAYPTFFIYNQTHKKQYEKIKARLFKNGYKKCFHFSSIPM